MHNLWYRILDRHEKINITIIVNLIQTKITLNKKNYFCKIYLLVLTSIIHTSYNNHKIHLICIALLNIGVIQYDIINTCI